MKLLLLLLIFTLIVIGYCEQDNIKIWQDFKEEFSKTYSSANEEDYRREIFFKNLANIEANNKRFENGEARYKLRITQFTDMREDEFHTQIAVEPKLTEENLKIIRSEAEQNVTRLMQGHLPKSVDWRTKGAVTSVMDQLKCGCCYSIAASGALEGHIFLKSGHLYNLSVQQAIDCSWKFNNAGCRGGDASYVFHYLKKTDGITFAKDYPYINGEGTCKAKKHKLDEIKVKGYVFVEGGDEERLKEMVATKGPIASSINIIDIKDYKQYLGGVIYSEECGDNFPNHAILIVGYGTTKAGEDYWLIKNSHGTKWGVDGYGMIARNKNNHCRIASFPSYPIIRDPKIRRAKPPKPKKL